MEWFARASRVIPGGIYGHATPAATVPMQFPYYALRAEGCRYWDVDGHEYLVEEILDQWCGPEQAFHRVRANDGKLHILSRQTSMPGGLWDLVSFRQLPE